MATPVKISIIVPVYNTEKYLHTCLDSIMAQTFSDFEAVLVDDGSTDSSGLICDEYAQRDSRFVVIHKQNEGVAKARITAFEHSKGDLITFIDSDDYVTPDYLEKLSKPILEDNADMVSCDYCKIEDGNVKEPPAKFTGSFTGKQIQNFIDNHFFYDPATRGFGLTCFLWSKMVRREYVLEGLKQGLGLWLGEDQLSMFTMLLQCQHLELIPERLYHYIQHEGQTVKHYDESLWQNIIDLMERYQKLLPNGIGLRGLRIRTWININITINQKMMPTGICMSDFVRHLKKVLKQPYMQEFFKQPRLKLGKKNEVRYWLLKLGWLRLFYMLFLYKCKRP